jgi:hypothetical protein
MEHQFFYFEDDEMKSFTIVTEVAGYSKTSVIFCQTVGRYVPEDSNIYAAPLLGSPTITSKDFKQIQLRKF